MEGFDAFAFFGGFAFGLRASLFDRICPLAIVLALPSAFWVVLDIFSGAFGEPCRQSVEHARPGTPRVRAPLQALTHGRIRRRRRTEPVRLLERAAPIGRILGFALRHDHLAFRLAAASASRAFE